VIDFLRANPPMSHVDIEQETHRYIADPGQALAYVVGRLEIDQSSSRQRQKGWPAGSMSTRTFSCGCAGATDAPRATASATAESRSPT
jgi:uncharacterized protein (DUF885 family)